VSDEAHADHFVSLFLADLTQVLVLAFIQSQQQLNVFRSDDVHDGATTQGRTKDLYACCIDGSARFFTQGVV
jgi:hypothetical protein